MKAVITLEVEEAELLLEGAFHTLINSDRFQNPPEGYEDLLKDIQKKIRLAKGDIN